MTQNKDTDNENTASAYEKAGVDIDAGARLVEEIKPDVKSTVRSGVMSGIGGFGAMFDLKETGYSDPVLVSSTDGVGTKLKIAVETGIHDTVGIDLVAMCVNDLTVQGAEPLFFLDYFASGKLDVATARSVIAGIAEGCRQAGCALIGGETAEMPGVYAKKDYDLAGFTVGAVERDEIITGERIKKGDVVIGLASSGLHSNGFSLVRKVVEDSRVGGYSAPAPFSSDGKTIGEALLKPTKIYVRSVLKALGLKDDEGNKSIKGMANITGGGIVENLPRVMPANTKAVLDATLWEFPEVFRWLAEKGNLESHDIARTFNCGIGMAVVCSEAECEKLVDLFNEAGETAMKIGYIDGCAEESPLVTIHNMDMWGGGS